MPRDTNALVVFNDESYNSPQDVAGNPTTGSGLTGSSLIPRSLTIAPSLQDNGEANAPILLITPNVDGSPVPPRGSGSSVVAEPELGTPIIKDYPEPIKVTGIPSSTGTSSSTTTTTTGSGSGTGTSGSATTGSGTGSSAGSGSVDTASSNTPTSNITPKKKNYVLYGGILLALIIAYKLLSKKKK